MYDSKTPGGTGGKRYSGFSPKLRPDFEYFLSGGIQGELEGERYKKTPELVKEYIKNHPPLEAPASYLVFKRWDKIQEDEQPLIVIFLLLRMYYLVFLPWLILIGQIHRRSLRQWEQVVLPS